MLFACSSGGAHRDKFGPPPMFHSFLQSGPLFFQAHDFPAVTGLPRWPGSRSTPSSCPGTPVVAYRSPVTCGPLAVPLMAKRVP